MDEGTSLRVSHTHTYDEVKESLIQSADAKKELMFGDIQSPKIASHTFLVSPQKCLNEVQIRDEFSDYIYALNKYSFSKSVLVVAFMYRFINNCRNKARTSSSNPNSSLPPKVYTSDIMITDEELKTAET